MSGAGRKNNGSLPLYYNNEQVLRSVIKRAYFSYGDEYVMFEELPAGERKHWCRIEKYDM
nr:hypothetical protein [uncultured Acetatifactor sp.]